MVRPGARVVRYPGRVRLPGVRRLLFDGLDVAALVERSKRGASPREPSGRGRSLPPLCPFCEVVPPTLLLTKGPLDPSGERL